MVAVNQAITGLYFTLSNASGGSLTSSSGNLTNLVFNGGGSGSTATAAGSGSTNWILETVGIYDHLCVICSTTNGAAPGYSIIGGTGTGLYANAGGSLGSTHSPFLYTPNTAGAVVYNLTIAGVNADTTLGEVWIQFNTDLTGPTPPVPEPASMALLGTGLLGLAGGIRRKLRR
ncbi:MAG TPA: PEP-CTERM sorting domain-containing protein [Terriglobales bacterium]|nr:PEP-CTERM sorting domain-containing protein [Terriglobales bacterium]